MEIAYPFRNNPMISNIHKPEITRRKSATVKRSSYLERITFDKNLLKGFVASWITNIRLVLLLVIAILFLGIASYFSIPKRLNPEIKIPIVTILTFLPGAGPEDVESLVTIPIENELNDIVGIDTLTSVSRSNVSAISVQFLSTVSQDKAKNDVQSSVDSVTSLPPDAQTPKVNVLDFEDRPVWTFAIRGQALPSLMRFTEELKRNLENVPSVNRINVSGYELQQISVTLSPEKMRDFGINPIAVSQAVKTAIASYPAGSVNTSINSFSLTIDPTITTLEDLRNTRISVSGTPVKLGDISTIMEISNENILPSYYADRETKPQRTVTMSVYKNTNVNFDVVDTDVKRIVYKLIHLYGDEYSIDTIVNAAEDITDQFNELVGEFRSTILLVMACLFVFLGLRQALISSLTVPLTFLSAFFFMRYTGMSINFLSLFAFLIALGLLIDDTIVTVQAMTSYYRTGKFTPTQTGLVVWRDLIVPIWSTTITTIWSFVPLLLSTGIIGEFIKPIPVVVTVTMLSSTAIAVLITLPSMHHTSETCNCTPGFRTSQVYTSSTFFQRTHTRFSVKSALPDDRRSLYPAYLCYIYNLSYYKKTHTYVFAVIKRNSIGFRNNLWVL